MSEYKTNVYNNAFFGLANGVNLCKEAVCGTIGGAGSKVIIKQPQYPFYIQTKDAYSIIQSIKCEDVLEQQAVDMMKDATDSMNKVAKDGRTAMCILTDAILQETIKQGANPKQISKELEELLPELEKAIDEQKREITVDDVEKVATTASNSERLGKLIASVYKTQGKDCAVDHIEASGTLEDYVIFHDGVRFKGTGYLAESMAHDPEAKKDGRKETKAVYENPVILVTKRKIMTIEEIDPLLTGLQNAGRKDLVIFTDDMDSGVVTMLINTHKAGIFNICIIKAPIIWKGYVFEDFAKCVGATIVEDATGITFKSLAENHLGTCGRIVIDKDEVVITGTADLNEWKEELKKRGDEDSKQRLHYLNSKGATIRLGATNEGELSNLRLATIDGVYSAESALNSGVVAGGGICLSNVARKFGNSIITEPLLAPLKQIVKNAGYENLNAWKEDNEEVGFNAKTGKFVNMFEAGIVDSAQVVKNSLRNAIAMASLILTTDKLVDIPKPTLEEAQIEALLTKKPMF